MTGEAKEALELDELKALCAAATPGPWYQSPDALWHVRTVLENALIPLSLKDGEPIADATLDADAAFIAASRTAIPSLIAEVERLTQERDRLRAALDQIDAMKPENFQTETHLPRAFRQPNYREALRFVARTVNGVLHGTDEYGKPIGGAS